MLCLKYTKTEAKLAKYLSHQKYIDTPFLHDCIFYLYALAYSEYIITLQQDQNYN